MLSIDQEGIVAHVNPAMSAVVKVPHRREVLAALRDIYDECYAQEENLQACTNVDTVCRFFGMTLEQLVDGS